MLRVCIGAQLEVKPLVMSENQAPMSFSFPPPCHCSYEYNRNPLYYQLTFNSKFITRLATWHTLNLLRIIFSAVGLLLVSGMTFP